MRGLPGTGRSDRRTVRLGAGGLYRRSATDLSRAPSGRFDSGLRIRCGTEPQLAPGRMSRCLRCGGGGQRRAREYEPAGVRRSQRCDAAVWRPMRCSPQVSAPQSVSGSTPSSGVERPSRQHPTANPRHVSSFAHSSGRTQGARAFRLDGEANYYLNLPSFQKWACPISWTTTGCGPSLRRLQQLGHRRHDSMPAAFLGAQLLPAGGGQRV